MKYAKAQRILRGEATASKFQTKAQSIIEDFLIDKVQRQSSINRGSHRGARLGWKSPLRGRRHRYARLEKRKERKVGVLSAPLEKVKFTSPLDFRAQSRPQRKAHIAASFKDEKDKYQVSA